MIWDVKIFLAKIKDCKGKDLNFSAKKKLPTKTPPNQRQNTFLHRPDQTRFDHKPMTWKELLRDYFQFTVKDRIAALLVSVLLVIVLIYPHLPLTKNEVHKTRLTDTTWIAAVKKLMSDSSAIMDVPNNNPRGQQIVESPASALFYFDPNTLSNESWIKLGIPAKTVQTIRNYLQKGGQFRKPDDLQKIYGLKERDYNRLSPYIKIKNPAYIVESHPQIQRIKPAFKSFVPTRIAPIDINKADTTELISLPGIGSRLANRIISFRNKLGGFYSIEQVSETFGLADSVFQKIKNHLQLSTDSWEKLDLNSSTIEELKAHPYIRYQLANAIILYRNQHGKFNNIEELKNIILITPEVYRKIFRYFEI